MSKFIEQIISAPDRKAAVEIISRPTYGAWSVNTDPLDGEAFKRLGTIYYCKQVGIPDVALYKIPYGIAREINGLAGKTEGEFRTDTVIIGHGPIAYRASGIPAIGREGTYLGWQGQTPNDAELTVVSSLPDEIVTKAIDNSILTTQVTVEYEQRRWANTTEITDSGWLKPNWNIGNRRINPYRRTGYTYWGGNQENGEPYPAYDIHYCRPKDFLSVYATYYSNRFGQPFLVGLIGNDGTIEERIWKPIAPERAPWEHLIKLMPDIDTLETPWIINQSLRMALATLQFTIASGKEAKLDPELVAQVREALPIQVGKVKEIKGEKWLFETARRKLKTMLHRAGLLAGESGQARLIRNLITLGWFNEVLNKERALNIY